MKRIVFILAGGKSTRMGGEDKALAMLEGRRLIDCVVSRLSPQADRLVISGRGDYGTGLAFTADEAEGPAGPAGGLFAAARWMERHEPSTEGFFTAPVDGPFAPEDLMQRLMLSGASAIAADEAGVHPTFAYWRLVDLAGAWPKLKGEASISLRSLARACSAREICWPGASFFFNVNAPEDLREAEKLGKRD
ncbi:MAG TPA: molybdenum cofactor guanylyltransferase [Amphiplicatus sp.]|nr:molybdenum cofactor guanylyltransferase [Amphiplicatus sp.]